MNKSGSSFRERLLRRTGGWYLILVLLLMQMVNTPLMVLLTAITAQQNAEFTKAQGISLLIFGSIALSVRNILLLAQFYYFNRDMFARLSKIDQPGTVTTDLGEEKRAWEQATAASKNQIFYSYMKLFTLVLAPILTYGYFNLHLSFAQIVYLSLAVVAAGLVNFILENLALDQWFEPIIQALLPKQFEAQLAGMKGLHLRGKLSLAIIGLVVLSLLLIVPAAYHQVTLVSADVFHSRQLVTNALLVIVNVGVGAIVVGVFLALRLASFFSDPFGKIIKLFGEVEKGDLSQRIKVSSSDEFGELNIYLNHMISRLHELTSNLERQVSDRTADLSRANEQLQTELRERKRAEERMAYSATHDSLTDLPNRVLFMDRLQHTMERARRHKDYIYAVLFLDLDRFKVVNDSLGHNVGDQLLIETASRLTACLRNEDTVARLGGDEFVILLEDIQNTTEVTHVAKRIQQDLSLPYDLEGHKVFVFVSIGIVLTVDSYERTEDILRDADIAMYRAKGRGLGGYEIFDPEMLEHVMTRLELETQLRKALEHEELVVHYQPILDLWTHRIVGFEALVRWQHPTQGLMSPAEFIPTAEETGLIVPLGYWVLEKACRQIRIWQVQFPADPPLTISVNWSTRQCAESDLAEKIAEVLQETGLDAHTLNLELTESLLMDDTESTITRLSELRALGVQVQIHDFGTGYSSLGYPHTLPIDTLKIDRSFISRLEFNNNGSDIVRMILTLAHDLGMKVVAEGVETDDQLSKLKEMDCEYVQGFLFAEPVDSQEAGALLGKAFNGIEDQRDGLNGI